MNPHSNFYTGIGYFFWQWRHWLPLQFFPTHGGIRCVTRWEQILRWIVHSYAEKRIIQAFASESAADFQLPAWERVHKCILQEYYRKCVQPTEYSMCCTHRQHNYILKSKYCQIVTGDAKVESNSMVYTHYYLRQRICTSVLGAHCCFSTQQRRAVSELPKHGLKTVKHYLSCKVFF